MILPLVPVQAMCIAEFNTYAAKNSMNNVRNPRWTTQYFAKSTYNLQVSLQLVWEWNPSKELASSHECSEQVTRCKTISGFFKCTDL